MKLILSSCDFRNQKSWDIIIKNLNKPIYECRVLYFPNEKATPEKIHSDLYINRLNEFGFSKDKIYVFDYYNPSKFLGLAIDIIYISGGNTFKTLQRIKNSKFASEICNYVKNGAIYIGGSAGAHIATADISHLVGIDDVPADMTDFKGLALFDGIFVCHYTEERAALYENLKSQGKNVLKLTDEDCIVIEK